MSTLKDYIRQLSTWLGLAKLGAALGLYSTGIGGAIARKCFPLRFRSSRARDIVAGRAKFRSFSGAPIVVITSVPDHASCVASFNLGADEYVPESVPQDKLVARLRALIRRAGWAVEEKPIPAVNEVVVGALRLRLGTYIASLGDTVLNLTRTEFEVLLTLARLPGKACTPDELVGCSQGGAWQVFDRGIDMHISALKRALGEESKEPRFIKTVRGVGSRLEMRELAHAKRDFE